MTRAEFAALLDRAVADGLITLDEADRLLMAYDAGDIDPPPVIPPGDAGSGFDEGEIALALALLLAYLALPGARSARVASFARRLATVNALADAWQAEAGQISRRYVAGEITLAQWQAEAARQIRRNVLAQWMTGAGVDALPGNVVDRLLAAARIEEAYLGRFADEVALRIVQGRPMSEAQIAARLRLYGGAARGQFFRGLEDEADQAGGWGYVYLYESVDDPNTCDECLAAEGYYLAGNGPYPGEICRGRGHCRCRRVPVYAPDIFLSLGGGSI